MPTALGAAGIQLHDKVKLDGVNLIPFLNGKNPSDPHHRIFWRYLRRDLWAIREGDWKLIHEKGKGSVPKLYNLRIDPAESNDVANEQPERTKSLQAAYQVWAKDLPKPLWNNDKHDDTQTKSKTMESR